MKGPKVTVLMSVYNGEKYLKEAIDSILNQTFKDFEFIIINDGSTDSTGQILERYNDARMVIINNSHNLGLTRSLNIALKSARGEYIARMDADDISLPERLERMVNFLESNKEVALLGSSYINIDEDGGELAVQKFSSKNEEIQKRLLISNYFGFEMFRRSCLEKVGFYREKFKYAQDYDIALRIAEKYKVANIEEPLYKYRVSMQSISVAKMVEQYAYAELARELARERRSFGKDRLQYLSREEVNKILTELQLKARENKRVMLANYYLYWAAVLCCKGNYARSKEWALRSLHINPLKIRGWSVVLKSLLCAKLSPEAINRFKNVYRRIKGK